MQWQTIGHDHIRGILEKQLAAGAVAQAYLFVGPRGVGKHTLAVEFAQRVLHAQFSRLRPIEFSFGDARIEQVRELIQRLSLRPQSGGAQVAILDEVERMSTAAANALLKTIEEPAASTMLILISDRDNVLATIRSRCQTFRFGRLTMAQMSQWAQAYGVGQELGAVPVSVDGSPGAFIRYTQEAHTSTTLYAEELRSMLQASLSERLSFVSRWAEDDVEVFTTRIATWLTLLYRQPELYSDMVKPLSVLLEAWRRLQTNANKKLVSEYVCINIV